MLELSVVALELGDRITRALVGELLDAMARAATPELRGAAAYEAMLYATGAMRVARMA